jgi:hypothetical protein
MSRDPYKPSGTRCHTPFHHTAVLLGVGPWPTHPLLFLEKKVGIGIGPELALAVHSPMLGKRPAL